MRLTYFVHVLSFLLKYSIHTKCMISAPDPILLFPWESDSGSGYVKLEIQVMERMRLRGCRCLSEACSPSHWKELRDLCLGLLRP